MGPDPPPDAALPRGGGPISINTTPSTGPQSSFGQSRTFQDRLGREGARVEVGTAFAAQMSEFLRTSGLTESKAFIHSFVKEITVKPRTATIRYTIPTCGRPQSAARPAAVQSGSRCSTRTTARGLIRRQGLSA